MPKPIILPSATYLNSCLAYDLETGALTWKARPREHFKTDHAHTRFLTRYAGKPAGSLCGSGYRRLDLDGAAYQAHRIVWCMYYGEWPSETIDHINLDKADNRISNLRNVERSVNTIRRAKYSSNSSGYPGVTYRKNRSKWVARIQVEKKSIYLGLFKDIEDAVTAYAQAKLRYSIPENHGTAQPTLRPNLQKGHLLANNSSGATGVTWRPESGKWRATIKVNKIAIPLGCYVNKSDAIAARKAAEAAYRPKNIRGAGGPAILPDRT